MEHKNLVCQKKVIIRMRTIFFDTALEAPSMADSSTLPRVFFQKSSQTISLSQSKSPCVSPRLRQNSVHSASALSMQYH